MNKLYSYTHLAEAERSSFLDRHDENISKPQSSIPKYYFGANIDNRNKGNIIEKDSDIVSKKVLNNILILMTVFYTKSSFFLIEFLKTIQPPEPGKQGKTVHLEPQISPKLNIRVLKSCEILVYLGVPIINLLTIKCLKQILSS